MTSKPLSNEVKTFIVQAVACFDGPATVVKSVNQEFGITITRQQVEKYDPTKRAGQGLSKKLRAVFEATRAGFISNTAEIGWSHRATRLRVIQRVGERAEAMGNLSLVLTAAKQAAMEEGNAFTNKVDHQSTDGSMSPPSLADFYGGRAQQEAQAHGENNG